MATKVNEHIGFRANREVLEVLEWAERLTGQTRSAILKALVCGPLKEQVAELYRQRFSAGSSPAVTGEPSGAPSPQLAG